MPTCQLSHPFAATSFRIISNDRDLLTSLQILYPYTFFQGKSEIVITAINNAGTYSISHSAQLIETKSPIQVIGNIIFEETVYVSSLLPLHAGAIEKEGVAYIFLAATGGGKTTLIAYLSESKYRYITDDMTFINLENRNVQVTPLPLHLRPESISILAKYGYPISGTEIAIENIHRIVYTPKITSFRELPIGGIFFIKRSDAENRCESIPKTEAVQLLMQNLMNGDAVNGASLKCAIKLADKCCHRLIYSDMRYVADIMDIANIREYKGTHEHT